MSSFTINQSKCNYHNKPLNLICLNPSCQGKVTCAVQFCSDCPESGHKFCNIQSFSRTFCLLINDRAIKTPELKQDVDIFKYTNRIKNYIQIDNLRLVESIMKCISDDKKYFYQEIDVNTKIATEQRDRIKKTLQKSEYFTYLFNYFSRPQLLELKLQLTNPKALVDFRQKFFEMDKLDNDDYNSLKKLQKLKQNIIRSCKSKITGSATEKFKEVLKNKCTKEYKPLVLMERKNSLQVEQPKRREIFSRKNSENKRPPSRF